MAFQLDIGFVCQTGRKEPNEDFCAAMLPPAGQEDMGSIVAIADGVSTGGMGGEAAQTTVTSLVRSYHDTPETWDTTVALDRIIGAQNAWLAGTNHRRQPAMGLTTLTALVLRGQSYTVAHVGDSRCYLLREGQTLLLTHDHVVHHPDMQHQLLRAVGLEDHLVVDYLQGDLQVGDTFVMLTDGVHGKLRERQLAECAALGAYRTWGAESENRPQRGQFLPDSQAHSPTMGQEDGKKWTAAAGLQPATPKSDRLPGDAQAAAERLVAEALAAGSDDNVTAMVVRVQGLLDPNLQDAGRAAQSLPIPAKLKVGEGIDGLTVTATVADNGINLLYQVRDPASQALYALKTLHPARAHDHDERAMLAHEAWLAKRMMSSRAAGHLVAVHDHLPTRQPRTAWYVLYDWHGGETLQQLLDQQHKLGTVQAVSAAMQTLRVLGLLHRQGVIHRDIKPANLHLGDDGVLRVLDLGVALSGREPQSMRRLHAGTPSFVNPEQWGHNSKAGGAATEGEPELPDAQSDLFALGVTLYQLLTGKLPYGEVLPYQLGRYYRDPTAPSRHNPEVPIWLDHVLLKAVARDKSQRFETAEEFLLALERGASRPLTVPPASALLQRDPTMLWKLLLGFSVLFNLLLVYWLLFLPTY